MDVGPCSPTTNAAALFLIGSELEEYSAHLMILTFFSTEQYPTVYTYQVFTIHSSVDGQQDYFPILAIVNRAVTFPVVDYKITLAICSGVKYLGYIAVLPSAFGETSKLISTKWHDIKPAKITA